MSNEACWRSFRKVWNRKLQSSEKSYLARHKLIKDGGDASENLTLFKQIIGSLMYLSVTRLDIAFVICMLSKFMTNLKSSHMATTKRVLRYVKGATNLRMFYKRSVENFEDDLKVYTDSDYAGYIEDIRSTSGYVFFLNGGVVAWSSRKQPVVTLSTTEAEYIAAVACACHSIWMKTMLNSLVSLHVSVLRFFVIIVPLSSY